MRKGAFPEDKVTKAADFPKKGQDRSQRSLLFGGMSGAVARPNTQMFIAHCRPSKASLSLGLMCCSLSEGQSSIIL